MKTILTLLTIISLISTNLMAQIPSLEWVKHMGGLGNEEAYCMTKDQMGNIYTAGRASGWGGTADFSAGTGTNILTLIGSMDTYIQKLDPAGNSIWVKQISGPGVSCVAWDIA